MLTFSLKQETVVSHVRVLTFIDLSIQPSSNTEFVTLHVISPHLFLFVF